MNYYALYHFRKNDGRYPHERVQIYTHKKTSWLIMGRELDEGEIEEFDLEYIGERMSYERVQSEIKRLSR